MSDKTADPKPTTTPVDPGTLHPGGGGFKVKKPVNAVPTPVNEPIEQQGGFKPVAKPSETEA